MSDNALIKYRKQIDLIDDEILQLLVKRIGIVKKVGEYKRANNLPLYVPERKRQIIEAKVDQARALGLDPERIAEIYELIHDVSLKIEETEPGRLALLTKKGTRVGYLGPEGTYTHLAFLSLLRNKNPLAVTFNSIYDVFNAVAAKKVEAGVVAAENSIEGTVRETIDYLIDFDLKVIASIELPIHHSLLSKETKLNKVTKVFAHPQALAQCRHWLLEHIPQAKTESMTSNLAGISSMDNEKGIAVIASSTAAKTHQLNILAEHIEDNPENVTKFYIISLKEDFTQAYKTLLFITVVNRVGVLRDILNSFADANINLDKIESRPSKAKNWDYYFFIQVDISPHDPRLKQALHVLQRYCTTVKIIGSF